MRIVRLPRNPIITPHMDGRMGSNINGPSLIRVPEWIKDPLGRYYLYFAHHHGTYIRLAYADELGGPWRTYEPGVLQLEESLFEGHVASPDVHVDDDERRIRMYYHGDVPGAGQKTRLALSRNGLTFQARPEVLGHYYFRVWRWGDWFYALTRDGFTFRSRAGLHGFQPGPQLFDERFRHAAVRLQGHTLGVFWSDIGDCPESIKHCTIDLRHEWTEWKRSRARVILRPEEPWEGADLPLRPSKRGWAPQPVNELRDPAIYEEEGRTYLLYSVAGEWGIAVGEIVE